MNEVLRNRLTLVACVLGSGAVFIETSVVNLILPAIQRDLRTDLAQQQWVVEAYLLPLAALLLVGGGLGDRYGRRLVFGIGLAGFILASLACAAAPSAEWLIAARVLQGVAGALLTPSTLAIITATFDEHERGGAIGAWSAWSSITTVIGPVVGGVVTDLASWRLVFLLPVALAAASLVLVFLAVPESRDELIGGGVDWPGASLAAIGLGGIVAGLTEQPNRSWTDPLVAGALALGVAASIGFVVVEARSRQPMMPLGIFANRNFGVGNIGCLALYGGLSAAMLYSAIFIQQVQGLSATVAGLVGLPMPILLFLLSERFGAWSDSLGPRLFMGIGPIVAGIGLFWLLRLGPEPDIWGTLAPAYTVFGLGLAATVAPLTAAILGAVERRHAGIASGVNNAVTRVAGSLAIAAVGLVVSARFATVLDAAAAGQALPPRAQSVIAAAKSQPLSTPNTDELPADAQASVRSAISTASVDSFHVGIATSAALVVLGGVVSLIGIRNPPREPRPSEAEQRAEAG